MSTDSKDSVSFDNYHFDYDDFNMDVFDELTSSEPVIELLSPGVQKRSGCSNRTVERAITKRKRSSYPASTNKRPSNDLSIFVPKIRAEPPYEEYDDALFHHRFHTLLKPRPRSCPSTSVVNFPTVLVNCLNSGDLTGLSDLLRGSLNDDCALGVYCFNSRVSVHTFLKYHELTSIVQPDRILFINDTNIMHNRVTASSIIKFTDCKRLFDFVAKTVDEPELLSLFNSRADHLKRRLCNSDRPEEEKQHVLHLIESDADLVMYGSVRIQVTFDEVTNKVTGLYLAGGLTSAHPVPPDN